MIVVACCCSLNQEETLAIFEACAGGRKATDFDKGLTSFYNGTQIDFATVGEHPQQLPGTRKEVEANCKNVEG
jgi:hypothetical protein